MSSKLYTQVMYDIFHRVGDFKNIVRDNRYGTLEFSDSINSALIGTKHEHVINKILLNPYISFDEVKEILDTYSHNCNFKRFIEVLQEYPNKSELGYDFYPHIDLLAKSGNYKNITDFFDFLNESFNTSQYSDDFSEYLILQLWKMKEFSLSSKVIEQYKDISEEKNMFLLIQKIHQGNVLSEEEIKTCTQAFYSVDTYKKHSSYGTRTVDLCDLLIKALRENKASILNIQEAIIAHGKAYKNGVAGYRCDYYYDIKKHHYEKGDFDAIEQFMKDIGEYSEGFYSTLVYKKILYYSESNNKKLHKKYLEIYIKLRFSDIKTIEDHQKNKILSSWRDRIDLCKENADINCEKAIFEFLHGEEKTANEYIHTMIEYVESITNDIPETCTKRNRGHIQGKMKKPYKRFLKGKFMKLGLLHFLPATRGWNIPIKDPDVREQERKQRKKEKVSGEEEDRIDREDTYKSNTQKSIQLIQRFLDDGNIEDALEHVKEYEGSSYDDDWERGVYVLERSPEHFHTLYKLLCGKIFHRSNYGEGNYSGFSLFIAKACSLGLMQKEDWDTLLSNFKEASHSYNGTHNIPHELITKTIESLILSEHIQEAWKFYTSLKEYSQGSLGLIKDQTTSKCLALFLENIQTQTTDPSFLAFNNKNILNKDLISSSEKIKYLDIRTNLNSSSTEYNSSFQELHKQLQKSHFSISIIREWCKHLVEHSLRTHHQIKDEVQQIFEKNSGLGSDVRRRIIYTLINMKIPGIESSDDIKSKHNDSRVQSLYFKKLIEHNIISGKTEYFLQKKSKVHIDNLRKLLAQYQNEFNTVIESLLPHKDFLNTKNYNSQIFPDFQENHWSHVFTILDILGMITPGIWTYCKSKDFNKHEIRLLREKITFIKKDLFKNTPLGDKEDISIQSEIIYQAYKPVNMSYENITRDLRSIEDCSHHLHKYSFPEKGYVLDINGKQDLTLRKGKTKDTYLDYIEHLLITSNKEVLSKDIIGALSKSLCEAGRVKMEEFDTSGFSHILHLFLEDHFMDVFKTSSSDSHNSRYNYLQNLKDFFDLYLKDNLEKKILLFFKEQSKYTSEKWNYYLESFQFQKRKNNLKNQLKIELDEKITPEIAAHVISQAILQKSKSLKIIKSTINTELKKYVQLDGSELQESNTKLRAYVSKNQASFFAKASAGLCTGSDIDSFHREDHFHINLIDDIKQICVGNLMAYEIMHKGEKILLLRGFNPNTNILKEIDISSYCKAMIDIATQFAQGNSFDALYMSETLGFWNALSNRNEVSNHLIKIYGKTSEDIFFQITGDTVIGSMYLLKQISESKRKNVA